MPITDVDISTLENKADAAQARGLAEVEWIMRNDPRVAKDLRRGDLLITREMIREALTDYVYGCKLPYELSWLRFTSKSTKDQPQRYLALDTANALTRLLSHIEAELDGVSIPAVVLLEDA